MHTKGTIAIIEDEPAIAHAVAARLESEGFATEIATDGSEGVDLVARLRPDLVVLDLMLPGLDGLEVCRRIQLDGRVPVIMLTARDEETDMLVGLGVGADDYITKPFSPRELVARVRAVLRRSGAVGAEEPSAIRAGGLHIDPGTRRVRSDGHDVHLTPTEFDLLHTLARQPDVVHSREQLLREVWGYEDGTGARTVDSHVAALRRKLGEAVIRTVHGVGYAFAAPGS